MMKIGDKVKLRFAGGHIGIITAKKYECSYPVEGKPHAGIFSEVELEPTDEYPESQTSFRGFSLSANKHEDKDKDD